MCACRYANQFICFHTEAAKLITANSEVFKTPITGRMPSVRAAQRTKAVARAVGLAKRLSPPPKQLPLPAGAVAKLPPEEMALWTAGDDVSWNDWQQNYGSRAQPAGDRSTEVWRTVRQMVLEQTKASGEIVTPLSSGSFI